MQPVDLSGFEEEAGTFAEDGLGPLRLKSFVETQAGYDSNPARSSNAMGSATEQVRAGSAFQSPTDDGLLRGSIEAGYDHYNQLPMFDTPTAKARLTSINHIDADTFLRADVYGKVSTHLPGTPDLPNTLTNRPLYSQIGTSVDAEHRIDRLHLGLRGSVDRYASQDGTEADGSISKLSDSNNVRYGAVATVGYDVTPGFRPFVSVGADKRVHDNSVDSNGYQRDSTGYEVKGGVRMDVAQHLVGYVDAGYRDRFYVDPRFGQRPGFVADASLTWTPSSWTKVVLGAKVTESDTTVANSASVVSDVVSLDVKQRIAPDFSIGAKASLGRSDYSGVGLTQWTDKEQLALLYDVSKEVVLKGSVAREHVLSLGGGSNMTRNVFLAGVRYQQ